jgi:hypothetical protein
MLNTGIVGIKNAGKYIEVLDKHPAFKFAGIYDPSLLVENPLASRKQWLVFPSFEDLCCQCQAIVFATDDKIYLPLIEKAIRFSLAVFVVSVQNLSIKELQVLQKLKDEAKGVLQIGHPHIYSNLYTELKNKNKQPLDIQSTISDHTITNLMEPARTEISSLLWFIKSNIRKVSVNIYSSFSEMPDMVRVRIDFENGSVGNVLVNKYGLAPTHQLKVFGYDNHTEICLITQRLTYISSQQPFHPMIIDLQQKNKLILYNQFEIFCSKIFGIPCQYNSIENELKTQWVMERLKEKLRLSLNIF